jgi:2-amino-4-deoxychorismate synthase
MRTAQPYCLLHQEGRLTAVVGTVSHYATLDALPRAGRLGLHLVAMIPYAQLSERGMMAKMEGEKIIAIEVKETVDPETLLLPEAIAPIELEDELRYNMSDAKFIDMVRDIIEQEIKQGEGSNFLVSRKCFVKFRAFNPAVAHTVFRRLMRNEFGAYLNFCFFDGESYFIGSSPERHMSFIGDRVTMNPICGTLPKAAVHGKQDLVEFLNDPKEINELFQVVDEELKMMCKICSTGGAVRGPRIREMRALFHTDYELEGISSMDKIDAFRLSMFAATMVGSPLESAARVIARYEPDSRRYYSSALLMLGNDAQGRRGPTGCTSAGSSH